MTLSRKVVLVLSVSALFMGPVSPILSMVDLDVAHAKGGNGNGGGGGNSGGGNSGGGNSGGGNSGGGNGGGGKSGGGDASDRSNGNGANGNGGNGAGNAGGGKSGGGKASATEASSGGKTKPAERGNGSAASQLKGLNAAHASAQALANASPNSRVGRIATYLGATGAAQGAAEALGLAEDALADLQALVGDDAAIAAAFPPVSHDEDAYQGALAAEDAGDPDRLAALLALTPEIEAEFTVAPEGQDPFFDQVAYDLALQDAAPSAEYARLANLTEAEKLAEFPDANGYDDAAYAAALAYAEAYRNAAADTAATAEAEAEAALMAASNGNTLDDAARAYLARLLDSKTLSPEQEEAVEAALDPAS